MVGDRGPLWDEYIAEKARKEAEEAARTGRHVPDAGIPLYYWVVLAGVAIAGAAFALREWW